jgi:AcrR family transcriptional regulator
MEKETRIKRSYDNSLRLQQQERTQEAIRSAAKDFILEGRIHNFTIQEVAERAGVSYPSVYRHFPSREALVEHLVHWGAEFFMQIQPPYPDTLEDLPSWAENTIGVLMDFLPLIKAMDVVLAGKQVHARTRERDEWFTRLVRQTAPELPEHFLIGATAVLRILTSGSTWAQLQLRFGLEKDALKLTVSEGIKAQIRHIKSGFAVDKREGEA